MHSSAISLFCNVNALECEAAVVGHRSEDVLAGCVVRARDFWFLAREHRVCFGRAQ